MGEGGEGVGGEVGGWGGERRRWRDGGTGAGSEVENGKRKKKGGGGMVGGWRGEGGRV